MNSKLKLLYKYVFIIFVIIYTCELILGISEAFYVSRVSKREVCDNIWNLVLMACIIDITIPGVICISIAYRVYKPNIKFDSNHLLSLLQIANSIVMIWSAIVYFNINSFCRDIVSYLTKYDALWIFVIIHFVMLWLGVIIFSVSLLIYVIISCKTFFKNNYKFTNNHDDLFIV